MTDTYTGSTMVRVDSYLDSYRPLDAGASLASSKVDRPCLRG